MEQQGEVKIIEKPEKPAKTRDAMRFGTFKGVFIPSILTIFGVIMYLRMGWVVGNAGLVGTIIIVSIASVITLITALSMSSIATNMKVGGGGAYFMVSRSLGVEAGAAIGLSLYFAKAIGTAFYIVGFAESVHGLFPQVPQVAVGLASLIVMTMLAYISADLALKASLFIFGIIILSLISLFAGSHYTGPMPDTAAVLANKASFWIVFAVFFPAVTGIEAGMSMSGDLKDPARSLPLGSIIAVLLGYAVYLAVPIFLFMMAPKAALIGNLMVFKDVSRFQWLVVAGVWGATLSSALGSLLGAPRNLQAIARDRIVPGFFGKGNGPADTPRVATAVTFLIALIAVLVGNLNTIAPVLSMFFLTTYGSLNLIAGIEGLISNPSWRPSFRTAWPISLVGAALCLGSMFMINAGATFIAIFAIALLYYLTAKRRFNARWLDIRRSIHLALARFSIYRLVGSSEHAKSWRPNILVLSGSPQRRFYLIELADAISHGKGFLTVASILTGEDVPVEKIYSLETSIHSYLEERDVPALVEVLSARSRLEGIENLVKTYGIGPLVPNTILLGEAEGDNNVDEYARTIMMIYRSKRNLVIVRENHLEKMVDERAKHICCWWGGKRHNAGLMLALGYMLQTSEEWRDAKLTISTIARDADECEKMHQDIDGFLKDARLIAEPNIITYPYEGSPLSTAIRETSQDADLVFIGMRPPAEDETLESYAGYYRELIERTERFPMLAMVLAAEEIRFQDIFE